MDARTDRFLTNIACVLFLLLVLASVAHLDRQLMGTAVPSLPNGDVIAGLGAPELVPLSGSVNESTPAVSGFDPRPAAADLVDPEQRAQYDAIVRKSSLELQQFRRSQSVGV